MFDNIGSDFPFVPMSYKKITKVVDDSDFLPDSELVRALRVSGNAAGDEPLYDYDDGVVPKDDSITPEIVLLRSGKLDKAEVQTLQNSLVQSGVDLASKDKNEAITNAVADALGIGE